MPGGSAPGKFTLDLMKPNNSKGTLGVKGLYSPGGSWSARVTSVSQSVCAASAVQSTGWTSFYGNTDNTGSSPACV